MATLSKNGTEVARLTCVQDTKLKAARGALLFLRGDQVSIRSNGVLLRKRRGTKTWKRAAKFKDGVDLPAFVARRLGACNVRTGEPFWQKGVVRPDDLPPTTAHLMPPAQRYSELTPSEPQPSIEELNRMFITDTEQPRAIDGCHVDPDGCCAHGKPSWALYLGFI